MMDRRQFLKILALSASASVATPLASLIHSASADEWPVIAGNRPIHHIAEPLSTKGSFPRIGVVAVGGGACGMLSQLREELPYLARRVAIDNSPFALYRTMADRYVWVGQADDKATDPTTVRLQAKAVQAEIRDAIQGLDLIWQLSSLGGAGGTGIAPIVADVARQLGIPVIAVSITPFAFEGTRRNQIARAGFNAITRRVPVSVELSNETLALNADDELLDSVLGRARHDVKAMYCAICSVLTQPGLIGVDLEDLLAAMAQGQGQAAFGHGRGNTQTAIHDAFQSAISHTQLAGGRLKNAKGVFVSIQLQSGNHPMTRINEIMQAMKTAIDDREALVVYGAVVDPALPSAVSISILAAL